MAAAGKAFGLARPVLQRKNFAKSVECTARLKAANNEKSVLAGSEFHTVKILHDNFFSKITRVLRFV